jgi:type IV secretory pathway TraG/TraD family ATPase VirD4
MSKNVVSDAGVGRALFSTKLQLSLQAIWMCLRFGALPGFLLPLIFWFITVSPHHFDIVKLAAITKITNPNTCSEWQIRDENGDYKIIAGITKSGRTISFLNSTQIRQALVKEWKAVRTFKTVINLSLLFSVIGCFLVWFALKRFGAESRKNRRIRGAREYVTGKQLDHMVKKSERGEYKLVGVQLPKTAPMAGIWISGAQGTGKSLATHDLMQQVFKKGRKAIIYDHSGEFFRAYYRPGKDFFFNPSLIGSVPWSIFSELKYTYDADTLAQAFLPPKAGVVQGQNAFFEDAARALFSVILLRLAERGAQNTSDIAKAFLEMPAEEMAKLIEKSVASSAMDSDAKAQRQGVISSIAIYLNGIASVADGMWSVRDFIDRQDDARFFILNTEDTQARFSALYRLLLSVSFSVIAAKQEIVHEDKYWFFMDEVMRLGDTKLDEILATYRKFGVCIVSGGQSDSQFITMMGQDRANTVMNCFNTTLMLRMNEPAMMERAKKRLGEVEMDMVSQNQALAVKEWRDGAGMVKSEQQKWLVMSSQIGDLANCTGFLKIIGSSPYPAAFVDYRHWLPKYSGASCYANKFSAIQAIPSRDPKFILQVNQETQNKDLSIESQEGANKILSKNTQSNATVTDPQDKRQLTRDLGSKEVSNGVKRTSEMTPDMLVDLLRGVE